MTAKIRKQIYVEPAQEAKLKRLAEVTGQSEAEIVRTALNRYMADARAPLSAGGAWEAILSFIEARMALDLAESERTWTREELHERSESVCGSQATTGGDHFSGALQPESE